MRIITPDDAAFTPSGNSGAPGIAVMTFSVALAVSANFVVPAFSIGTIPADGQYQFTGFVSFKNGTADPPPATFVAEVTYTDGAGAVIGPTTFIGITGGLDEAYLVAGTAPVIFTSQAGASVLINYGASGITFGSVDVAIGVAVIRIA